MIAAHGLASLPSPSGTRFLGRPGLAAALAMPRVWQLRRRYRADLRRLLTLGPYLIDAIGLGLGKAIAEASKPFWRA